MQQYYYDLLKTLQERVNANEYSSSVRLDAINHACREALRDAPVPARVLDTQELNFGINPHKACTVT